MDFAHSKGVKVHVTANILAHNRDLKEAEDYFGQIGEIGPDALIISDPGMFELAGRVCPSIERHVSTQANNTNYGTFLFWHKLGAKRVVCARELSLEEIKDIRAHIPDDLEIECFVHGAMCISYSGRCLLSNYFTGRDANRGECTHPCRWTYSVSEETRPGHYLPVYENERGTYIFNSKDLCMIDHIPEFVDAGVDSFKIEGRMKNALYVAVCARTYRRAIDDFFESREKYENNLEVYREEIRKCTMRDFSTGFYFGKPDENSQIYDNNTYIKDYVYLGFAECAQEDGSFFLHQKNKFSVGDSIEIMRPNGSDRKTRVLAMWNTNGESVQSAPHPGEEILMELDAQADPGDLLRMHPGRCGG